MADDPCTACGACCASFRVDFSVRELLSQGGSVPDGLSVEVNSASCRMRGTDHSPPRCAALYGKTGEKAICGIYGIYFRQDQKNDDKIAKIGNAVFAERSGSVVDNTKKQQRKEAIFDIHFSVS